MKGHRSVETMDSRTQQPIRRLGLTHTGESFLDLESITTVAENPERREALQNMHRI